MHMITLSELRSDHQRAVVAGIHIVEQAGADALGRPTPCSDWNLLELLAHMTAQHRGFAAAARGAGGDPATWDPAGVIDAVAADPAGAYSAAAGELLTAFADDNVLDASLTLPDFGPGAEFPFEQAVGFHFVDYVVHAWDVARAVGVPFELPDNIIDAAVQLALMVPDGDFRAGASAPFGPALDQTSDGTSLDRLLRHLGRSPEWRAPAG
jgi:uncharacterized protein (TIGR03086 family)